MGSDDVQALEPDSAGDRSRPLACIGDACGSQKDEEDLRVLLACLALAD